MTGLISYSSWLTLLYKEVVEHVCNPLWLISHWRWLNHTATYKSSDLLQKQESIKHCLSHTRQLYICFLFVHPWWKLKVYRTLPTKIHHPAAREQGHGAVSEGEWFPAASFLHCQMTPLAHNRGCALESCWSSGKALSWKGHTSYSVAAGYPIHSRAACGGWRCEADSVSSGVNKRSKYIGWLLLTYNSKISCSVSKY